MTRTRTSSRILPRHQHQQVQSNSPSHLDLLNSCSICLRLAEFTLNIQPAAFDDGTVPKPITLSTHDIARLRVFLGEAKRFKEKASPSFSKDSSYEWLSKYVVKRTPESLCMFILLISSIWLT